MFKQLYFIVAVVSLTACGADSGSSSLDEIAHSGNCKEITPFVKGGKSKFERTLRSGGKVIDYRETLESDKQGIRQILRITSSDNPNDLLIDTKSEFYIQNHFSYPTKTESTTTIGDTKSTGISTYSPHGNRLPWDQVCKGDTWSDTFTVDLGFFKRKMTTRLKIEDIDVKKTVKAGTFDTYILAWSNKNKTVTSRQWFDMETGEIVYKEDYNSDGNVSSSGQLLEYVTK